MSEDQTTCAACGVVVLQPAPSKGDLQQQLIEANRLRVHGHYTEAISICTDAIQIEEHNATAHSLLGDIYREQGNFREALGWYKQAVRLQDCPADRRKLDEMIDRVFQNTVKETESLTLPEGDNTRDHDDQPGSWLERIRDLLSQLQPVHIVIGCTVLAMVLTGIILGITAHKGNHVQTASVPPANTGGVVTATRPTQQPQVTPPPGDPVENPSAAPGDATSQGPGAAPIFPGIVMAPPEGSTQPDPASPTGTMPPSAQNAQPPQQPQAQPTMQPLPETRPYDPSTVVGRRPPSPSPVEQPVQDVAQQIGACKSAIERAAAASKVQTMLGEINVDASTGVATVNFGIQKMANAAETKRGLLYVGFQLVWAGRKYAAIRSYTLRGFAYEDSNDQQRLSFIADVSQQQADAARNAGDYRTVSQYLNNTWWRDDLMGVTL